MTIHKIRGVHPEPMDVAEHLNRAAESIFEDLSIDQVIKDQFLERFRAYIGLL